MRRHLHIEHEVTILERDLPDGLERCQHGISCGPVGPAGGGGHLAGAEVDKYSRVLTRRFMSLSRAEVNPLAMLPARSYVPP